MYVYLNKYNYLNMYVYLNKYNYLNMYVYLIIMLRPEWFEHSSKPSWAVGFTN